MRKLFTLTAVALTPLLSAWGQPIPQDRQQAGQPATIIFETDMGNDVDDALALDMLYKYADLGTINLLAVMTNKNNRYSAEYIDIMNTWYGYPDLPLGIVRNGVDSGGDDNYAAKVCLLKDKKGRPLFRRSGRDLNALPDAHRLYRKLLAAQPDNSVTIVSVGFSTNLVRLLNSAADEYSQLNGRDLVARKVQRLIMMAGGFDGSNRGEYNVIIDIPSAKTIFHEWPTPIVTSPWEVGTAIEYPAESIINDFGWLTAKSRKKRSEGEQRSPMVEAYKAYLPMPYDRPTWDLTAVLYAVEGPDWFSISRSGTIHVSDKGVTTFSSDTDSHRRYLIVTPAQAHRIRQHFINLVSQPTF